MMKFLPLLFANLFRRKVRTILTLGSFAVSLFLFCLLVTIRDGFNQGVDAAGVDRVWVLNKTSIISPLPFAYGEKILRTTGVKQATWANWFGGVYKDEKNFFPQFAIETVNWREVYREFLVPEDQWKAFVADRAGAIAGQATADRFGWKVGDKITIKGAIFPGDWEFTLRGIYKGARPNDDLTQFWFQWEYLKEKAPRLASRVGWYVVRIEPGADMVTVSKAIDTQFANSPFETRTQTEAAMMASFVEQMGNIEFLIQAIGSVVFFTLLLVTGNTMAIAVRERTGELAVLKTVGFTDGAVLSLVLAESLIIAALGGAIGIALAKAFTLGGDPTNGMLASFYLSPLGIARGGLLALTVGLLAGAIPAISAMRLPVVDALRRI